MIGCSKDERDKLGRWQADQSDDYLRSSRATVFAIQSNGLHAIVSGDHRLSEDETFDAVRKYGEQKQLSEDVIKNFLENLGMQDMARA
eukprot:12405386-Karenia_brevis.AAC.1